MCIEAREDSWIEMLYFERFGGVSGGEPVGCSFEGLIWPPLMRETRRRIRDVLRALSLWWVTRREWFEAIVDGLRVGS